MSDEALRKRDTSIAARARVGANFFRARGLDRPDSPAPSGIIDSMRDYGARDAASNASRDALAPSVRSFFEDTASLELWIEPRWAWWALPLAWVWHYVARWLGQLCLPVRPSRITTETIALDDRALGSPSVRGSRAVIRRYDDRACMQVLVYSVFDAGDQGMMLARFPLPWSVLEGVLRCEFIDEDQRGLRGARLTSEGHRETGVFLRFGRGASRRWRTQFGESLSLWDAQSDRAPAKLAARGPWKDATIIGLHEQRFMGLVIVRHSYWFRPIPSPDRGARPRT
ncbi:MAG: hypothetical protein JNK05_37175 [Myxococcales bacterium]|nr:hypothetical protein [Myxococcales bacterium]